MATGRTCDGKPCAGSPHIASAAGRRSLLDRGVICVLAAALALAACGEGAIPVVQFGFESAAPRGMSFPTNNMAFAVSGERTPEGEACGAFTLLREPGKVAHDVQLRFNAPLALAKDEVYSLRFYAKASCEASVPVAVAQTRAPWRNYVGGFPWLGPEWRQVELRFSMKEGATNQVMSVPFIMAGMPARWLLRL